MFKYGMYNGVCTVTPNQAVVKVSRNALELLFLPPKSVLVSKNVAMPTGTVVPGPLDAYRATQWAYVDGNL